MDISSRVCHVRAWVACVSALSLWATAGVAQVQITRVSSEIRIDAGGSGELERIRGDKLNQVTGVRFEADGHPVLAGLHGNLRNLSMRSGWEELEIEFGAHDTIRIDAEQPFEITFYSVLLQTADTLLGLGTRLMVSGGTLEWGPVADESPTPPEEEPPPPPPVEPCSSVQNQAVGMINDARATDGAPSVLVDLRLVAAAQGHADYLAQNPDSMSHNGPGGSSWDDRLTAAGYHGGMTGAVLAFRVDDAAAAVALWLSTGSGTRSRPTQRDFLLESRARHIGVGFAMAPDGGRWAVVFGAGSDGTLDAPADGCNPGS